MKIAMAFSEVAPYAKTGGLADVGGALPLALEYCGHEVIVIMPKYKCITNARFKTDRVSQDISLSIMGKNVKVYFIEHNAYFNRDGLYGDKNGDYPDNLERFGFFCRRGLDLLREINFSADILHLHDWQSSLMAVYLRTLYRDKSFYARIKTLLTIHNIGYQGIFAQEEFSRLGLEEKFFDVASLEFYGKVNLLKGGIIFADLINTVSPTYARQIQTPEFGFGLDGLLKQRQNVLSGILNGVDYSVWDPGADKFLRHNFSIGNLENKELEKEDLQNICGLPINRRIPVLGIVSRLAEQKGLDILSESLDELGKMEVQLVILGTGDQKYHQILKAAVKRYPKMISLNLGFDDPLAHKIYGGCDIFLMPSKYEPCGLGQLISLRYGAIPLVFKTGGLADTVDKHNGFVFTDFSQEELLKTIKQAVADFGDKAKWNRLVTAAMECDFSWKVSADRYARLYAKAEKK